MEACGLIRMRARGYEVRVLALAETVTSKRAAIEGEGGFENAILCSGRSCVHRHAQNVWLVCRRQAYIL